MLILYSILVLDKWAFIRLFYQELLLLIATFEYTVLTFYSILVLGHHIFNLIIIVLVLEYMLDYQDFWPQSNFNAGSFNIYIRPSDRVRRCGTTQCDQSRTISENPQNPAQYGKIWLKI